MLKYPKTGYNKPSPLIAAQREERKSKGLYFYRDEKFTVGHQCNNPKAFMMVVDDYAESKEYSRPLVFDKDPEEGPNLQRDGSNSVKHILANL